MDERRQDTSLTDEGIDRAISKLLEVEPSVDFVARVRTRVDNEPASSGWRGTRFLVAAIAIACVAVGVAIWTTVGDGEQPSQSPASSVAHAPAPEPVVPAPPQTRVATPVEDAPLPPVLVSPAEADGLRYFVSAVREGRVDPSALPADGEGLEPMPIVIEPITVEPLLTAADIQSGELQ